jgi:glutamate/tyrosine decarboxylase-like PLP-dependent enzyme
MYSKLRHDLETIDSLLEKTLKASVEYLNSIGERPPALGFSQKEKLSLPREGMGAEKTLELFLQTYGAEFPVSNGPKFWGFVTGGTTPASLVGDWLTSTYDLNLSHAANSNAPNIEMQALEMLKQLFGLPANFSGAFVSGATMSNFAGLAMGREWLGRQHGASVAQQGLHAIPSFKVLSSEAHSSSFKALAMLGIGRDAMNVIPKMTGNRESMDIAALRAALLELNGDPCIVIANAGTVNTVDFDALEEISALKREFKFWLHVDAAFGGFAACSPLYQHLVKGIHQADSLTVDAHKWLNVPYDAAMIFTPHRDLQIAVFQNSGSYLGAIAEPVDFIHLGPENSRRMRALPAWFSLMAYGQSGYREIVESNCRMAQRLGEKIETSTGFRLLATVRMNVVCFTVGEHPSSESIRSYLNRLRGDGRVFMTQTTYNGVPGIRAAFSNWRTTEADVDTAWQAMQDCLHG